MRFKLIDSTGRTLSMCKTYKIAEKHATAYRQRTNDSCFIIDTFAN